MSQKRQQEDGKARVEGNGAEDNRRKVPKFCNVVREVIKLRKVQDFMEPVLEPLIRKVVKEEVELALRKYLTSMKWNCGKEIQPSELRSLQLQFLHNLSLPVFTGTRIEGEDCTSLKVALFDAVSKQIVDSGPESLARVEIVVLEGDFDGEEGNNWTHEEFRNNIVREREGKKPLLTGDAFLNLKEGVGLVGEISFTDNSSWTRSRKFRLGARVVDNCDGVRVREAKTESFIVRDHRGELYKKHHPPSLFDEVWRLEKIGKEGAFHKRLSRERVTTVKDFLTLLYLDPTRLRNILGTGMSAKMWEVTVDHARTCTLDKKLYLYCPPGFQPKTGVVFNIVGQVMGLLSECECVPVDKLSETKKADAHNMVISAFKNWEEVVSFEDEASLMDGSLCLSNILYPSSSSMTESSDGSRILTSHKLGRFDYPQPSASSPDVMPSIYSMGSVSSLDDFGLHNIDHMDLKYDQIFSDQVPNSLICDTSSITQAFCEDEHLKYFDTDCALQAQNSSLVSQADLHSAVNGFLLSRSATVATDKAQAQRRWAILFSVFRWFSIRRIVAKKTHGTQRLRHR
ncbi:calmodulin-binding protein 60 A [Cornus florida]|uniref:calmodulin-binding protein 60 A n=1 Tax=Cornus florida TaxID=4283 RepID=UPI00289D9B54|nr:calmodulin-binding protein 60 A [Cornus florida]